jgi:ribosomal protein L32
VKGVSANKTRLSVRVLSSSEGVAEVALRNCLECGSLFQYRGKSICPGCTVTEELEFAAVYNYVSENKGVSIEQVSEATGVGARKILRFLRDERLATMVVEGAEWISCSRCGKPIQSQTLCDRCTLELAKEICGGSERQDHSDSARHAHRHRMFTAERLK